MTPKERLQRMRQCKEQRVLVLHALADLHKEGLALGERLAAKEDYLEALEEEIKELEENP